MDRLRDGWETGVIERGICSLIEIEKIICMKSYYQKLCELVSK